MISRPPQKPMPIDKLASEVADDIILHVCKEHANVAMADALMEAMGFKRVTALKTGIPKRKPNWLARDRFLAPHEKRVKTMMRKHWKDEYRVITSNMNKYPLKGKLAQVVTKGTEDEIIDQWLYPSSKYSAKLSKEAKRVLGPLLSSAIKRAIADYGFDIAFQVVNDSALSWLSEYAFKFSDKLEAVSIDKLRMTLTEGIRAGESIDKLKGRVFDTFEKWSAGQGSRAEAIARTECSRAENYGNLKTCRAMGIKRKVWFAFPDCCEICAGMDNEDVPIDELFSNGEDAPPAHVRCRCSLSGFDEEWAG
jgi:SPP1 gp7 family putative phage head morphogenesis protein